VTRLFVAAWPTPDVRSALEALPRPAEPGVRWVPPEQWHVTLRFLGEADPGEVAEALGALRTDPATATLGPAVSRLGRAVICVPVHGLEGLAAAVTTATGQVGEPPDPRPFTGHLTLARLGRRGSCRLAGHRIDAEMPATSIDLVASHLTHDGPSYEVIQTVQLVS